MIIEDPKTMTADDLERTIAELQEVLKQKKKPRHLYAARVMIDVCFVTSKTDQEELHKAACEAAFNEVHFTELDDLKSQHVLINRVTSTLDVPNGWGDAPPYDGDVGGGELIAYVTVNELLESSDREQNG